MRERSELDWSKIYLLPFQYLFGALRDCVPMMGAIRHLETPEQLRKAFDKEIRDNFEQVGLT